MEGAEKGWSALSGRFGGCFVGLVARKASCLIFPSSPIDHLTALCTFQNLFRYAPSSKSCRISSTVFPSPVSVTFSLYPSKTKFGRFV